MILRGPEYGLNKIFELNWSNLQQVNHCNNFLVWNTIRFNKGSHKSLLHIVGMSNASVPPWHCFSSVWTAIFIVYCRCLGPIQWVIRGFAGLTMIATSTTIRSAITYWKSMTPDLRDNMYLKCANWMALMSIGCVIIGYLMMADHSPCC